MTLLAATAAKTLLDLNDDCLLNILEYLSLQDTFKLIGVAERRLDEVAYRRIAMCKQLNHSLRDFPSYNNEQLAIIARSLKTLELSVGYALPAEKVLQLLRPLCAGAEGAALRQLTLHYVNFDADYAACLSGVAPQLIRIDLSHCQLSDELLEPLLLRCNNLRELKLIGNYTLCGESLRVLHASCLQALEIEMHEQWTFDIEQFFTRHSHVRITAYNKGRRTKSEYVPKAPAQAIIH